MRVVAHVKDGVVADVSIRAEDDAEHAAWLALVGDDADEFVEVEEGEVQKGYERFGTGFRPGKPFDSWKWVNGEWRSPVPAPAGSPLDWDETTQSWKPFPAVAP